MKRYLIATAAVALIAAACSGGSAMAATVNGSEIVTDDVGALAFDAGSEPLDDEFTQLLNTLIQWHAVADAAKADFGIEPTEDEIAAEVDRLYADQGLGATFEEYLEVQNISERGLNEFAEQLLIGEAVLLEMEAAQAEESEAEAQRLLLDDPATWTEVCAAHILVETVEDATVVLTRLEAGEDFAGVAAEVSLDPTSGAAGGDLGCESSARYVPEFADATLTASLGEVVGPVETQFGFHLIRVDSRTEATIEQILSAINTEAVRTWYESSIVNADIVVAEEFGTWATDPFPTIVAPQG